MTRQIHDYEYQNVLELTQQYIDEREERFSNLDKLIAGKNSETLANAVFGSITMIYMCRYCLRVMDVMAMVGPNPGLFKRSKDVNELLTGFEDRYQIAMKNYKEISPVDVGEFKSQEKLREIHRLASVNFGSKKFDMDIDVEFE